MDHTRDERTAGIQQSVATRRDEMLELLGALVRAQTISGAEDQAEPLLTEWFQDRGWMLDRQQFAGTAVSLTARGMSEPRQSERANLIGWLGGPTGRPVVTINAHYDVVPVIDESDWSGAPFSGKHERGATFGRGSVDNKGGCVTAMYALQAISDAGIELAFDLAVELIMGEETTGLGTIASLEKLPNRLATIVTEPTGSAVVPANSGALFFTIAVEGRAVHTSVPWMGEDALAKLVELYGALRALGDRRAESHRHELMQHLPSSVPMVVGILSGGGWRAAVPAHASMSGRIGVLPGESLQDVRDELAALLDSVAASDEWLVEHPPVLTWDNDGLPGWEQPVSSDLVQSFVQAQHAVGTPVKIEGLSAGCDAGVLRQAGIDTVVFGPGEMSRAHSPDEHVLDEEVAEATTILANALVVLSDRTLRREDRIGTGER